VPVTDETLAKAIGLRDAGNVAEAVTLCMNAIAGDPKAKSNAPYYAFAGECYVSQGNLQLAIECYRRAVYLQPSDARRTRYDALLDAHRTGKMPAAVPMPAAASAAAPASPTTEAAPGIAYPSFEQQHGHQPSAETLTSTLPPSPLPLLWRILVTQRSRQVFAVAVIAICISVLLVWHPWIRHRRAPAKVQAITETAPLPPASAGTTSPAPASTGARPPAAAPPRTRTRHHTRTAPAASTATPAPEGQP
jgi:hypothetical protein